jgi:DNA gyrase subunit A
VTETTLPPGDGGSTQPPASGGRIEPVELQQEMQRSYIDYAMSVIVGRALPDVRDGLKPVHRRVLYSMYDTGLRPERSHVKCSRVVGDVMGNYHPHGDSAIYDALVRLAQPWSMRHPLIDGQGNFGSPGNDPPAAMRYCVTGDTRVRLADGPTVRIADIVPGAAPNSDNPIDLKVLDRHGNVTRADLLFHSGEHPTLTVRTREGHELTGTHNHPVLCLVDLAGIPTLLWKTLGEITPGDRPVLQRTPQNEWGGPDTPDLTELRRSVLGDLVGSRSADKRVPEFVWNSAMAAKRFFLQALFTGDGSISALPRSGVQVSYSTRSDQLAADVQQLLLEFGVVGKRSVHATGEHKVVVTNRRDAWAFATRIGFIGAKQDRAMAILRALPLESRSSSGDHVPGLAAFLRRHGDGTAVDRQWLAKHNIDRIERWEQRREQILSHVADPDARAIADELTDGRFYYATVTQVRDSGVAPVYSLRVDSADHAFITNGFVSHNTEARLTPLAMQMLADIDEDTVDFADNYDGKTQEPLALPARIPNLLVNGGSGIAVGMATNIPPHNLREIASGVVWALENYESTDDELLAALLQRVKGPDFPTKAQILGTGAIEEAYRTGRGAIRMRSVVEVEEDARGRTILNVTELPYQVNPDSLIENIAALAREGKVAGIADIADESNHRGGMRIVITLKRDAVAKVVLNNLYKHTQLQTTFGVNMLSLVDGVPRTLRLDQMVRYYVRHQIDVIVRRTRYRLRKAEERAHLLRGLVKALDLLDEVIALIRRSENTEGARTGLMTLLDIDEAQATAILEMQLRRLSALERQKIIDELAAIEVEITDLRDILDRPERQRSIVRDELMEIVDKHGNDRKTTIIPFDGEVNVEDLIAVEDVVVTITRTGYAKRTKTDLYRAQKRGGKGVQGAALKQDDIVAHFFVCSTHDWILFFTTKGRVYRTRAFDLPDANRNARGQHVANLLAFQPDEEIAQVIHINDYNAATYLVLATRNGLVKKSRLAEFDSNRSGGLIGINLREEDELVGAVLCEPDDDLLLVSAAGQSIRFPAEDESLRPMGRATSGVLGMRFNNGDELLSMGVVQAGRFVLVATDGGYAKRTPIEDYPRQGRGGKGVLTVQYDSRRGRLVGALIVDEEDELYAITSTGGVIRTTAKSVRKAGRQTKGVRLMNLGDGTAVVAVARNAEDAADPDTDPDAVDAGGEPGVPDAVDGTVVNGTIVDDVPADGVPDDGDPAADDGTAADGTADDGTADDGTADDGTGTDQAGPRTEG